MSNIPKNLNNCTLEEYFCVNFKYILCQSHVNFMSKCLLDFRIAVDLLGLRRKVAAQDSYKDSLAPLCQFSSKEVTQRSKMR